MFNDSSSRGRSCPLLLLAAAALVALGVFFVNHAPTAKAQASGGSEVWSATLTVGQYSFGTGYSLAAPTGPTGTLSNTAFTYDGVSQNVVALFILDDGNLQLNLTTVTASLKSDLALQVGNTHLPLADATTIGSYALRWANPGLSWSAGDTVQVKLVDRTLTAVAGSLDHTFGADGKVTTAWTIGGTARDSRINDVARQPDGKIVAVGYVNNGSNKDFAIARYNADGSLDGSFGTGGLVYTDISGHDEARAVAIQSDGKIVVAGLATVGGGFDFAAARYRPNGALDTSFSGDGKATHNMGATDVANDMVIQTINNQEYILLAGQTGNSFGLLRYTPTGRWTAGSARFWTTCGGRGR